MAKQEMKVSEYDLQDLLPVAMIFVVAAIGIAFGLNVLTDIQSDFQVDNAGLACGTNASGGTAGTILYTNCGGAYNASADAISGVTKIPAKLPILATIIVAALIIGILMRYLFVRYA